MRVNRQVELEEILAGLQQAAGGERFADTLGREHVEQAAAFAPGAPRALGQRVAPENEHAQRHERQQCQGQEGSRVADMLDRKSGDQRAGEAADRVRKAVIAEVARAAFRRAHEADHVLQRHVVDGERQAVRRRRHEYRRQPRHEIRNQHAQSAAQRADHQQPARAEAVGQFAGGPRQQRGEGGESRGEQADCGWCGAEMQRVEHEHHAPRAHAAHVEHTEGERKIDRHRASLPNNRARRHAEATQKCVTGSSDLVSKI